ncbi:MAG: FG-GAP repeat protein [Myxococcales bacterium]|nr:FG-GAP repeat protein [Myxococcales bacterium]
MANGTRRRMRRASARLGWIAIAVSVLTIHCAATPTPAPCEPSCRTGFVCVRGACVSACNPACAAGERCTAEATCVRDVPADGGDDVTLSDALDAGMDATTDTGVLDATTGPIDVVVPDSTTSDGGSARARPLSPMSGSISTTRRPTFRWVNPAGATEARVEFCNDRACSDVITTIEATDRGRLPTELRTGWVFWRVRARVGGTLSEPSPTWQVWIPSRETMVDRSYGLVLDVNGDGLRDSIVGSPGSAVGALRSAGSAFVFHGAMAGVDPTPARRLDGTESTESFGTSVAAVGDVNGDGYGDIGVGSRVALRSVIGAVKVFLGGPAGVSATPVVSIEGVNSNEAFGERISALGDINGDGYADFGVFSALGGPREYGTLSVYLGGEAGPSRTAVAVLEGAARGDGFGGRAEALGDINGDGFGDFVVGHERYSFARARIPVFFGRASGVDTMPAVTLATPMMTIQMFFGATVAAGDFNGDGLSDVAVGASGTRVIYVYHGISGSISNTPTATLSPPMDISVSSFGSEMAAVGDLNRDGFDDLVVSVPSTALIPYFGNALPTLQQGMPVRSTERDFARTISGRGDFNGDGFADIVVGGPLFARGTESSVGVAHFIHGTMFGIASTSARRIEGSVAMDRFGWWVH